ncbi:MAG: polyamine aminopropyltransferase [Dehalococcoidia bacterium]|tara:strand:- start:92 stop:1018 length:927 start_codon:yes stop_codon:yes gene_type:complete
MNFPDGEWIIEPISNDLIQAEKVLSTLIEIKTDFQEVKIIEGSCFGKSLILDGKTQSTELDEYIYHESLVHPAMICHQLPKKILIIGGGEGATLREILKHPSVESIVMVDIDQKLIDICKEYLPNHHQGSFDDSRVSIVIEDAFKFVENTSQKFDVIIVDVPDPLEFGPAHHLFTLEFYEKINTILQNKGILCVQAGATGLSFIHQSFTAVLNTMSKIFCDTKGFHTFIPSFGTTWGFGLSIKSAIFDQKEKSQINQMIKTRKISKLNFYDGETHLSLFNLPKYVRDSLKEDERIITMSNPLFVNFET